MELNCRVRRLQLLLLTMNNIEYDDVKNNYTKIINNLRYEVENKQHIPNFDFLRPTIGLLMLKLK